MLFNINKNGKMKRNEFIKQSASLTGRKLMFDPISEKFVNDPEADKLLTREYRKPYVMPEKV